MLKIPNTIIELDKFGTYYTITPNEGYVLHDKVYDYPEINESCIPTGKTILGYRSTTASVHINNDLSERKILDENGSEVAAFTEREFFCKLKTEVPENQIM